MPVPYRGGMNEKSNQIWSRISVPKTPIGIALSPNSKQLQHAKTKLCYHFSTKGKYSFSIGKFRTTLLQNHLIF